MVQQPRCCAALWASTKTSLHSELPNSRLKVFSLTTLYVFNLFLNLLNTMEKWWQDLDLESQKSNIFILLEK